MVKKIIGGIPFQIIRLSKIIDLDTEPFPNDPEIKKSVVADMDKVGVQHNSYQVSDHIFRPHADAPNHQNPEAKNKGIEVYNTDDFFNSACMVDLTKNTSKISNHIKIKIKKEDLIPFEKLIKEKNAIIIRTGYDKYIEANLKHSKDTIPFFTEDAAKYLSSFENIKVIATDSLTVDKPGYNISHQIFKNKLIIEALVHLDKIPEKYTHDFDLETSIIQISGATGGAVSAFAFIRSDN